MLSGPDYSHSHRLYGSKNGGGLLSYARWVTFPHRLTIGKYPLRTGSLCGNCVMLEESFVKKTKCSDKSMFRGSLGLRRVKKKRAKHLSVLVNGSFSRHRDETAL